MTNLNAEDSTDLTKEDVEKAINTNSFDHFLRLIQEEVSNTTSYPKAYAKRRLAGVTYYRVAMTDDRVVLYRADWLNDVLPM